MNEQEKDRRIEEWLFVLRHPNQEGFLNIVGLSKAKQWENAYEHQMNKAGLKSLAKQGKLI